MVWRQWCHLASCMIIITILSAGIVAFVFQYWEAHAFCEPLPSLQSIVQRELWLCVEWLSTGRCFSARRRQIPEDWHLMFHWAGLCCAHQQCRHSPFTSTCGNRLELRVLLLFIHISICQNSEHCSHRIPGSCRNDGCAEFQRCAVRWMFGGTSLLHLWGLRGNKAWNQHEAGRKQTTRRFILEDRTLHSYCFEDLKSYTHTC